MNRGRDAAAETSWTEGVMAVMMDARQPRGGRRLMAESGPVGVAHLAVALHAGVAGSVVLALTAINALVDQSTWWVLWVAWAWSMVLALHAGTTVRWHGWLGTHLAVTALFSVGLFVANLAHGGGFWSVWPVVAVAAPLLGHWLMVRRQMPLLVAQTVTSGILLGEVIVANVIYPSDRLNAGLSIVGAVLALSVLMVCSIILIDRRTSR